jgi:hypothetical protein
MPEKSNEIYKADVVKQHMTHPRENLQRKVPLAADATMNPCVVAVPCLPFKIERADG